MSRDYTGIVDAENSVAIYNDLLELPYEIADKYDVKKTNNNITLLIDYKGIKLRAVTNFTFTKDGEPGTNGTEIICQIVPNISENLSEYPMILNGELNFSPEEDENAWFRIQMWHNGEIIYENTVSGTSTENKDVTVRWDVLYNKYTLTVADNSDIAVTGHSFEYLGYNGNAAPANIIKCTVTYDGVKYYATLPLITAITEPDYSIKLDKNTGFRTAVYSSDGRAPQYDNTNPFQLTVTKMINGFKEDVSKLQEDESVTYRWYVMGKIYNPESKIWEDQVLLDDITNLEERNQARFKPVDEYNGECVNIALRCEVSNLNGDKVAEIHMPIHFLLNRYGQAALNDWDGNHISIDKDGNGAILAPQVGAGQKEDDNSFTGALMGVVKESGKAKAEVGIFGYNSGERTFFLNSKDGSATLGKQGSGQLLIDPSEDKALIYSHDYWKNYDLYGKPSSYGTSNKNGAGMLIDMTEPRIEFGSGNFKVSKEGYITARGGGDIAGWNIDDNTI